jgi:putative membrane protein
MRLTSRLALAALTGALTFAVAAPAQAVPAQIARTVPAASAVQADTLCGQDRQFLRGAHQSNLAEITGGYVAQARSTREDVRHIGHMLIEDHTRLDATVRATARRYGVALPLTPSARQIAELLAVSANPPRTFDRAWLRLQEVSHLRTLALIDAELARGCAADVKAVAATARPPVVHHLEMVRAALARG